MKKILICLLFSFSMTIYAQDQLFKKDNSKVDAKILEINQTEIKYKLFTYQDGPTITVSKKEIALIIYQNGVHEVMNVIAETPPAQSKAPSIVYNSYPTSTKAYRDSVEKASVEKLLATKNLVSFNMLEPMNGSLGLSYLREFGNNNFHLYIPFTFGFAAPYFTQGVNTLFIGSNNYYYAANNKEFTVENFKYTNKTYEIGLGIHFQTSGKRAVTHFVGPYVGTSEFVGTYTKIENRYDPNGYYGNNYTVSTDNKFTMQRVYVMVNNGFLFRVTKNFNIMLIAGLGYHIDTYKTADDLSKAANYNKNGLPLNAFKGGITFGYRF